MNILFICRGNVGRSQMAEAIFKTLATTENQTGRDMTDQHHTHQVLSAGTRVISKEGESWHGQVLKDLPDANVWQDGVNFKGAALYPVEPSSNPPSTRGFFRLVRQD